MHGKHANDYENCLPITLLVSFCCQTCRFDQMCKCGVFGICAPDVNVPGAICVCSCWVGCAPNILLLPIGVDTAPKLPNEVLPGVPNAGVLAPPKPKVDVLAPAAPRAGALEPPKDNAELLAAPKADPPKDGALKPPKRDGAVAGWLCGAPDALAKLKAEDEAPNSPAKRWSVDWIFLDYVQCLACIKVSRKCQARCRTWRRCSSKDRIGCPKGWSCWSAGSPKTKSRALLHCHHASGKRMIVQQQSFNCHQNTKGVVKGRN